jgi:formate dehydrogenase major subunit
VRTNEAAYLDTSGWGYQLDGAGRPQRAKSLDDPRSILARLRSFFSRYTRE